MKKYICLYILCLSTLVACHTSEKNSEKTADKSNEKITKKAVEKNSEGTFVLTSRTDLEPYVGKKISIQGEISNTKLPQIIGVDVDYEGDISVPKIGRATGILIKTIVPKDTSGIIKATRGEGTFYHLQDVETNTMAKAEVVNTPK